jgi:hypothetical protein
VVLLSVADDGSPNLLSGVLGSLHCSCLIGW